MHFPRADAAGVAYGTIMFCSSFMNNIFITYYVELFTSVVRVDPLWFYVGQLVFMLWNAANDPLLGWVSDTTNCHAYACQLLHSACARITRACWQPKGLKSASFSGDSASTLPSSTGWRRRVDMVRVGGLLWCAAFVAVWWPWAVVPPAPPLGSEATDNSVRWLLVLLSGLHFTVSLCLYDGFLTYTEVNHSALLAEMTLSQASRTDALTWSSIGGAAGSFSSFAAYATWSRADQRPFFRVCVASAAFCALLFEISCRVLVARASRGGGEALDYSAVDPEAESVLADVDTNSREQHQLALQQQQQQQQSSHESLQQCGNGSELLGFRQPPGSVTQKRAHRNAGDTGAAAPAAEALSDQRVSPPQESETAVTYQLFLTQLVRHPNFRVVVIVSCVQVFDCTFEKNFFSQFMEVLSDGGGSSVVWLRHWHGALLLLSFLLPHLSTLFWAPLIRARGLAETLSAIFYVRVFTLLLSSLVGRQIPALFMLANRVLSESVCRLFPLVLTDVIDEDAVLHQRHASLSASVIGAAGALSKLSQSLAPMLAYALLPSSQNEGVAHSADAAGAAARSAQRVWLLLLVIPLTCVLLQVAAWHWYTLRGTYLKEVKDARAVLDQMPARRGEQRGP